MSKKHPGRAKRKGHEPRFNFASQPKTMKYRTGITLTQPGKNARGK